MTDSPVPVLDFSQLDAGPEAAARFRADLRQATHEVGFFALTGHGASPALQDRLLATARAFFALPDADKLAIENLKSPQFHGYARLGGELTQGRIDWREQIDIGPGGEPVAVGENDPAYLALAGPNLWPANLPELREVIEEWTTHLTVVARRLLTAWAESLGADPDDLLRLFDDAPATLLKVVRYPGMPDDAPSRQGVGSHKDSGVLTLLWIEPGSPGLQVEYGGRWFDVPPVDGALVVNIGELLEWATDGYLRATVHRVVAPAEGTDRISVPFFFNPRLDAELPRLQIADEFRAAARGVEQDPDNVIHGTYGENLLKSRLRAHPDVAAIHHPQLLEVPAGV
ncbi:2-oxoglutarate and iron-dependent oxygenase domain-containing protein [Microbacterium sp.]|uniref:isopenicillin N synthase family dioxygenase n=1 Tax=Microbacterium sp. TaxID=51671 RepID=UPI0026341EF6|nr:2-oxoglutarate and iron-dependent oxygenase domain-containing protein [Microbacterium sp.]